MDQKQADTQEVTATRSLSAEDISTDRIAPVPTLEAWCQNDDPRDAGYGYYDSDPHNTQW